MLGGSRVLSNRTASGEEPGEESAVGGTDAPVPSARWQEGEELIRLV